MDKLENDIFTVNVGRYSKNIIKIGPKNEFKDGVFYVELTGKTDICYEQLGARIGAIIKINNIQDVYLSIGRKLHLILSGIYLKLWTLYKPYTVSIYVKNNNSFKLFTKHKELLDCITTARTLSGTAPNICTPKWLTEQIKHHLPNVEIFDKNKLQEMKMNMLLAVAKGSVNDPYVVKMGNTKSPKIAIIGKGVTFDTGGISIKPAKDMDHMMGDMSGAAATIGAMKYITKRYDNVIGLVGLVENMPDGGATRPGDIIDTEKGSVQILNTDAEGRLVLGDVVNYAAKLGCEYIITIATLTGATNPALGSVTTAICSNNPHLINISQKIGKITSELTHPLPMGKEYDYLVKGTIADYQNIPSVPEAGVIAGAKFIEIFSSSTKLLHIDIASTALCKNIFSDSKFNGYGVRHLIQLIEALK